MRLEISSQQAEELKALLDDALRDMSHEIAATENPAYRAALLARRGSLTAVAQAVAAALVSTPEAPEVPTLVRELAHPGD